MLTEADGSRFRLESEPEQMLRACLALLCPCSSTTATKPEAGIEPLEPARLVPAAVPPRKLGAAAHVPLQESIATLVRQ